MVSEIFGAESSDEIHAFPPINPRVSIPDISMSPRGSISNSIKEWLEELLSSSSNIGALADSSLDVIEKGDGDLRIREMIAEERHSMAKYTELTVPVMFAKRFIKVSYATTHLLLLLRIYQLLHLFLYPDLESTRRKTLHQDHPLPTRSRARKKV